MKPITRDFLEKRKAIIVQDLLSKVEAEDWHGVADAAMDLREIAVQLPLISELPPEICPVCRNHNALHLRWCPRLEPSVRGTDGEWIPTHV